MTTPRFWTDPLSGVDYTTRQRLTSDQMNKYVNGLRTLDTALEWNQVMVWPTKEVTLTAACVDLCYDYVRRRILLVDDCTGDTTPEVHYITLDGTYQDSAGTATAPVGGWTTTDRHAIAANSTTVVFGAETVGASNQKVATLQADGSGWDIQSMVNAEASVGPVAMVWDPHNELFIAGLNGTGATGKIETSPDGATWSARTASTAETPSAIATDGSGTTVVLLNASTNKAMRSVDGVTWADVTLPATSYWSCVTYCPGLGLWLAGDGESSGSTSGHNTNYASSADGITWTARSFSGFSYPPKKLATTGNLVLAYGGYGSTEIVRVSSDGSAFINATTAPTATSLTHLFACKNIVAVIGATGSQISIGSYFAL